MASSSSAPGIRAILRASNHFDMLQLPKPHADLLEQPVWDVAPDAVHRAFRKLSLCCHPDKSTHPDAPRAFEALKRAKACLSSELERDDYLLTFVRQLKTSWEGSWASADSAVESRQRVTTMRDAALREQGESVADAMRERHERIEEAARRKQRLQQAARARANARRPAADAADDDDDDDDDGAGAAAAGGGAGAAGRGATSSGAGLAPGPRKRPKFL